MYSQDLHVLTELKKIQGFKNLFKVRGERAVNNNQTMSKKEYA